MASRTIPVEISSVDRQSSNRGAIDQNRSVLDSYGVALFVVFAGFALRTWRLDSQSFWWDDAYSTMVANRSLGNIVATISREDFHPPLHYFLFHYWIRLVGQSEFSVRFVTVMAGVLTVAVASAIGYRLAGRRGRLIVAAVFAFSPYLYYYSQEARPFALTALFATLSYYCLLRAVDSPGWHFWLGYTVALALGFYDLYYGLFVPLGCGAWLLAFRRGQWRQFGRWFAASVGAFVLFLPWVPIFIGRASVWSSTMPPDNGPAKIVYWSWLNFFIGLPSLELYRQPIPAALVGVGALLTAVGIGFAWRRRSKQPDLLLMFLAFGVPLLAMAAVSAFKPIFHPRYAMPAAPGLYLLLGGVIAATTRHSKHHWRLFGCALAVVTAISFGYGLFHLEFDPAYARDNYRGALAYVDGYQAPGDTLIDNAIPPVWYYYHGPAPTTYFPFGAYGEANVVNELNAVTAQHPRLWYVENVLIPSDPDNLVETQLRLHTQLIHEAWFGAIRVQLWGIPHPNAFSTTTFKPVTLNLADGLTIAGYAVNGELQGSQTADVELKIQTNHPTGTDDGFWIAVADAQGNELGRDDVRPHDASLHLSSGWTTGETVIVRFGLPIAPGTPPGHYQLVAGAYRLADLAGINVLDASNQPIGQQAPLGPVDITRADRAQTDPKLANHNPTVVFPGLILAASDLGRSTLAPGDRLPVTLLWRSTEKLAKLSATVKLVGPNGQTITEVSAPVGGVYPSDRWSVGDLIRQPLSLALPANPTAGNTTAILDITGHPPLNLGSVTIVTISRSFSPSKLPFASDTKFGDTIALSGYGLSSQQATPGGQLTVSLDWHALRETKVSYHVFVHLLDAHNQVWAQWDGVPHDWQYPTSAWVTGEYVLDRPVLKLPNSVPVGNLTLEVGLYNPTTGKRLAAVQGGKELAEDRLILARVPVATRP